MFQLLGWGDELVYGPVMTSGAMRRAWRQCADAPAAA
jgi:hypothetical protein